MQNHACSMLVNGKQLWIQERRFDNAKSASEQYRADAKNMVRTHDDFKKSTEGQIMKRLKALRAKAEDPGWDDEEFPPIKDGSVDDDSDDDMDFSTSMMGDRRRPSNDPMSSASRKRSHDRDEAHDDDAPQEKKAKAANAGGPPSLGSVPKLRSSSENAAFEKAKATLEKSMETYSEDKLWEAKIRVRAIQTLTNSLASLASPLTTVQNPVVEGLCKELMAFSEATERKYTFFQAVRQAPLESINTLADESAVVARMISSPVMSKLLTWVATEVLKKLEQEGFLVERTSLHFQMMSFRKSDCSGLSLHVYMQCIAAERGCNIKDVPEAGVKSLQYLLFSMWVDKVLRAKNEKKFHALVSAFLVWILDLM